MIVLHFVPEELSDEAAAHMLEYLHGLAGAFENQYFAQIRRYYDELAHPPRHRTRAPRRAARPVRRGRHAVLSPLPPHHHPLARRRAHPHPEHRDPRVHRNVGARARLAQRDIGSPTKGA